MASIPKPDIERITQKQTPPMAVEGGKRTSDDLALAMANLRLIGRVALGGVVASGIAYASFASLDLNGSMSDRLWVPIVYAAPDTILAWVVFALCGVTAYAYRLRLAGHPIKVTCLLVGLPVGWIVGLILLYRRQTEGWWPVSFLDENWRWVGALTYAQFAFGLLIGCVALAGFAVRERGSGLS